MALVLVLAGCVEVRTRRGRTVTSRWARGRTSNWRPSDGRVASANTSADPNRQYEGMRIAEAAKKAGKDPFDFVSDLLVETRGSVSCVCCYFHRGPIQ